MRLLMIGGLLALGLTAYFATRTDAPSDTPVAPAASAAVAPRAGARWFDAAVTPRAGSMVLGPGQLAAPAVYGRNGRAVDFGGMSAAAYIAANVSAARMGDTQAAYRVYQAESVCANQDEPAPEFKDPAQRDQFMQERAHQRQLCDGVSPAQIQERMQFLAQAARAGNAAAQIDFYMEGPNGRPADPAQDGTDPLVQQWKNDAMTYLKDAAGQCDHFALSLLASAYTTGDVTAADPKLAMAYNVASIAARKVTLTPDGLQRLYGNLAPADFQAGLQLGQQIASNSCPATQR